MIFNRVLHLFVFVILNIASFSLFAIDVNNQNTVLIIGGAKNIGKEIATEFAKAGWDVWVTSRDVSEKYRYEISRYKIRALKLDITNHDQVKKIVDKVYKESGKINVLVNNAGYGLLGSSEAVTIDQIKKQFDVNFYGPVHVIQEVLPIMRQQGGGCIINISSTSAVRSVPGLGMYAASKMALEGFSEALAAEVAPWNIKVSVVQPATVKNNWIDHCVYGKKKTISEYKLLAINLDKTLRGRLEKGQEQSEVGKLVFNIVTTNEPHFRYQTGEQSISIAKEVYVDPAGDYMKNKMIELADGLYKR